MATPRSEFNVSGFAKKQLEKHGWKQGKGLGKSESGISDPIKVKIKHDTAGVGHDLGEQFTYHWWDHVFNKAANNIEVENHQDGVTVTQIGDNAKLISNKKQHTKPSNKPLLYGNFLKSATLVEDVETPEGKVTTSSSDDDGNSDEETDVKQGKDQINRDEEFFRACGGRTAHKGARHGLKSSAKLKRIQAQESLHSAVSSYNSTSTTTAVENKSTKSKVEIEVEESPSGKKRKKKKKRKRAIIEVEPDEEVDRTAVEIDIEKLSKKDRKREKRKLRRTSPCSDEELDKSGVQLGGASSDRCNEEINGKVRIPIDAGDEAENEGGVVNGIQQDGNVFDKPGKKKRKKSISKSKRL